MQSQFIMSHETVEPPVNKSKGRKSKIGTCVWLVNLPLLALDLFILEVKG